MSRPLVSIIIANYNGEIYLKTCLDSVLASNYKNFEIILIDDGSTDESLEIIEKFSDKDKRITFLKNKVNIGAAASRNLALKGVNGEIVLFLDNDTEIEKNSLQELVATLKSKDVGACQALILEFKERDKVQMAGGKIIPQLAWIIPYFQRATYEEIKGKLKPIDIIAISAALAVKRSVLDKVGFFDEKEAIHTEDLDFSWRIWITGNKIVLSPKAIVYHYTKTIEERARMKTSFKKVYFHLAKNSFRSMLKNYEMKNLLRFLPISIAANIMRGFVVFAVRRDSSALTGTLDALRWSLANISSTLRERRLVKASRVFPDKVILSKVFENKSLIKIYNQNFKHTRLLW